MSGSGGGGGGSRGGGGARGGSPDVGQTPCEALAFETQLSSPKSDVIAGLKVGEVLDVVLKQDGGVQTIQVLRAQKVAGGLTAPDVKRLRECILSGHTYKATVTAVTGGQVKVRINPA
jgi:hypothetical protein